MKRLYGFVGLILGLIIIGIVVAPRVIGGHRYDMGNSFGPFSKVIETDKEVYELGDRVKASFLIVNHMNDTILIKPLTKHEVTGYSEFQDEKTGTGVSLLYERGYQMEILPKSKRSVMSTNFKPQYPGKFIIEWMGVKKTVEVKGYKEVTLDSPGITLEAITNQTCIKNGDRLDVFLIIRNDNPYPVKVPVYDNITISSVPITKQRANVMVSWVTTHFQIEANSYDITWHDIKYLHTPNFSIFYMVDGCRADLQFQVTDDKVQVFDPVWVDSSSEGMSLFLEPSEGENSTILIRLRNENPYPVRVKPFSKIDIDNCVLGSELQRVVCVDFFVPFWDIPAHSTRTIYNTDAYASPTRTPIYYTLYNKTLRYPSEDTP